MRILSTFTFGIGLALAAGSAFGQEQVAASATAKSKPAKVAAEKPNALSPAERKAGFKLLFDGKTLKGWRGYNKPEPADAWKVVDGSIVLDGKGGDLLSVDQYDNFELRIDWKIAPNGNSGLMYRVQEAEKSAPYMSGPEYQFLDDEGHPDAKAGKDGNHRAGALYDVYPPAKSVAKPAGEWNTTRLIVDGNHVEHWLNGEKVVEAEIGSDDWNARVAASKWKNAAEYAKHPKGHIDLQDHGDRVEFRNIRVRTIKPGKLSKAAK